jgi:hypothetical protein
MTVTELETLWAKWLETHDKPVKGSKERTAEFAVRDILRYLDHYRDDLTLHIVSSIPGMGRKRISYLEELLGFKFTRKAKPVKPSKPDEVIYVLFEKLLDINFERVAAVYATLELANEMLEEHWELFGRERSYRIELMTLETKKDVNALR